MVVLVVALVFLALIVAAWLVDRHDRRQGRAVQDGREIAERIRLARKQRRTARMRHAPGVSNPQEHPRPIKRGQ